MKIQLLCALVAANLAFANPIGSSYSACFSQYFISGLQYCGGYPDCQPLEHLRSCMIQNLDGVSGKVPSEEFVIKSFKKCLSNVSKTVQENSSLTSKEKETVLQSLKDREVEAVRLNKECSANHN